MMLTKRHPLLILLVITSFIVASSDSADPNAECQNQGCDNDDQCGRRCRCTYNTCRPDESDDFSEK
uniref:Putative salivary secreted protein n=1 Tax=Ornithodoros parkeri TaxID=140564 RepID=A6N9Y4_ORNPR|nr:putative salivary secreted protein [Ornithodoros parkeri]